MNKNTPDLSDKQLDFLQESLQKKRIELLSSISNLQTEALERHGCSISDISESASHFETTARAQQLIARHQELLEEVSAALVRLDTRQYGICEKTDEQIPLERLKLVPWTRVCNLEQ
ncbi:MAG: DnaK suppressor protein [Dinoroseobacter sp.]|jgi:DnaK suppressor protein